MAQKSNLKQLVVIGAGPGGYAAAFHAADLGLQVTLLDSENEPGGVCLYKGCIPSKTLLQIAKVIKNATEANNYGVEFSEPKINLDRLRAWKNGVIKKLAQGLRQLCKQRKIEFIQSVANFSDSNTLEIRRKRNNTETILFDHAVLATGSHPATIANIQVESQLVMNSAKALELENIPKSMLVVGGGYIGLELGSVYAALGTEVSVVEMTSNLMPGMDTDLVSVLARHLEKLFDSIMLNTTIAQLTEQKDNIKVRFEGANLDKEEKSYEKVLIAVGRRPNSFGIGLENTNVQIDEKGFVRVNEKRQTEVSSIYAIGDVAGEPQLAHKATYEGMLAAKAIAGFDVAFEPRAIPFVEYTEPEIAQCGLSEKRAVKENRKVSIVKFPWSASGRAATLAQSQGMTKLILDPETERILGIGIVGVGAGELISEGALAIEMSAVASDIAWTIHPHPTLSETLMEAAKLFLGHSIHLYHPRKA